MNQRFPHYLPVPVRDYISVLLDGKTERMRFFIGFRRSLFVCEEQLLSFEAASFEGELHREAQRDPRPFDLRLKRAAADKRVRFLRRAVDCLEKLSSEDERMKEAVAILTNEFDEEGKWRRFFLAAWRANDDFIAAREASRKVRSLVEEVGRTAEQLAEQLRSLHEVGSLFLSPISAVSRLPKELQPRVGTLRALDGLIAAARDFNEEDQVDGASAPTLLARQTSVKTGYLRTFALILTHTHLARVRHTYAVTFDAQEAFLPMFIDEVSISSDVAITPAVMRAMALVAEVVLSEHDVTVTYDDVRKALATLRFGSQEN